MPEKINHNPTFARIQELHKTGATLREIAETIEAEGVPQIGKREKWNHSAVSWCLTHRSSSPSKPRTTPPPRPAPPPPRT